MSFSKARLRRFNEEISQVPSPGRYDPKLDSNVKGAVMPSSKRFPGQAATSSSLDNIEKASTASSGVVFRTPQLMRKVALTPRLQYLKEKNFDTSGSDILSSEERPCVKSALKKTVSKADYRRLEDELNSLSDRYQKNLLDREIEINILKEQLNEIKMHEVELTNILEEKSKLASDRHREALLLKQNLDTMVEKIHVDRDEHQRFINDLKSEISELQNKKYELETVLAEKQSVIVTINDKYSDLEYEFKSLQEENVILEEANSYILMSADEKFQQFEKEGISKLETCQGTLNAKFEEELRNLQTKVNYFVHEYNSASRDKIDQIKQTQEKVKELEKLVDKRVKEFSEDIKEADERCKYLFRELCKVEEQRDELLGSDLEKKLTIIDLQEKSDSYTRELEESRKTCKKYQITLNTMNQTISALSTRLFESEKEVERLNAVEKDLESQKQHLEEKSQLLLSDIAALRESMDKMEVEIIKDVSALKADLEAKADLFKEEALKTEQSLNNKIHDKQVAINLLLNENEYFKTELEKKDELMEKIKKKEKMFKESLGKSNSERLKLEEEFSEKLSAQKNLYAILSIELDKANSLISDLNNKNSQDENQIKSLLKQLKELKEASMALEITNTDQLTTIHNLQSELQRERESEIKQKQYVDELISDLVLEKERCVAVEVEKNRLKAQLNNAELTLAEKSEETEKLLNRMELLQLGLTNCEEKLIVTEDDNAMLKQQLKKTENSLQKSVKGQVELEQKITELKSQLSSAREKIKTEIPKLERDNINKAENILELNLSVDSFKEEIELLKTQISCLEAEKSSLYNVLEEKKSKICDFEMALQSKNLEINALNEEHVSKDMLCQDLLSQLDSLTTAHNKLNEELKQNNEYTLKLIEAEDKISDLEIKLLEKDKEIDLLSQRIEEVKEAAHLDQVDLLKEQLEELKVKWEAAVEERDRLSQEVGHLMGHQNVNQKIKKVSELQQHYVELKEENERLRLENHRMKTKLETMKKQVDKENVVVRREDKQKAMKQGSAKKKPMSPSVLKPANH